MQDFVFHLSTKVFFGKGKEKEVGQIIKGYNFSKVLVHYGQNSVIKSGLLDKVKKSLEEANIKYVLLGGVEPNPKISLVLEAIELCKKEAVEIILAVGGGSVIDSAKSIAHGLYNNCNPWLFNAAQEVSKGSFPVGVILTLAAAGSEMSNSCVITNEETSVKRGFNCEDSRPLFSICNPELTYTVSKFQTACGIVDILMHTVERYYSINKERFVTDDIALGLCKSILRDGLIAYNEPTNYNARASMMWASSISHNGITGIGYKFGFPVHFLEHEISGKYDQVAHAAGLSAIYCSWARYVYKENLEKFARFAYEVMDVDKNLNQEKAALKGINLLEEYFKQINMPTSLSDLNIKFTDEVIHELASNVKNKVGHVVDFVNIGYDQTVDIFKMAK